ncbi:CBASS cGAMP-activated phospholipase [Clostridium beijerinckii]|uniref:CBASS cGAMP-activated phospholipase n=1 Tax=Clostridium beijerinckii TaxID=1520 RepID=UPI000685E7C6|nr:CBASS cGAMP-activated phospholipase [Clostridium beijerinckii]
MCKEKKLKVLSIDGGGIKGLYSAYILKYISEEYNVDLNEYFDMYCGTSTGGIIALALAHGIKIDQIIDFYEKKGPLIFPNKKSITYGFSTIKQLVFRGKYSDKELKTALIQVFGDKKIKDLHKNICIPAIRLSNQQMTVFKKDHSSNLSLHNNIKLADVALATSAAPTYFPIAYIKEAGEGSFIDGGLGANDPALIGAIEVSKYFIKNKGKFDLLSIASISNTNGFSSTMNRRKWSIFWFKNIIEMVMNVQSVAIYNNLKFLKDLLPCDKYIRIESPPLSEDQRKTIKLDNASPKAIKTLCEMAFNKWAEIKNSNEINDFFI